MRYLCFLFFLSSAVQASDLYYLDRVEIDFSGANKFYSKNCSNVAEVQNKLTNPLRYKVSLDCKTSKDRPIGLSLIIPAQDVHRVLDREETIKLRDKTFYCL